MSAPRTPWRMTYLPDAKAHGAEIFTELTVSHLAKGEGGWRVYFAPSDAKDAAPSVVEAKTVVLAAGTLGSTEILLRSRERGLGALRPPRRALLRQWRHHRLRPRRQGTCQRHRRRASAEIRGRRDRRLRHRPDRASRRGRPRPLHDHAGRRAAVGARAASARVLHRRRQAARRRAEPDQGRLSGPAVPSAHLLRRLA